MFPAEAAYDAYREQAGPDDHTVPPVVEELKVKARERGLWNLFLPSESGLTQLEYAPLAELSGWSNELAPEAMNCQAPDTGNMELLHLIGTEEQKDRWLRPLLEGEIRSAFCMTEPGGRQLRRHQHRHPDHVSLDGRTSTSSPAPSGGRAVRPTRAAAC